MEQKPWLHLEDYVWGCYVYPELPQLQTSWGKGGYTGAKGMGSPYDYRKGSRGKQRGKREREREPDKGIMKGT